MKGIAPIIDMSLRKLVWPLATEEFLSNYFGQKIHISHGGVGRLDWLRSIIGDFDVASLLRVSGAKKVIAWFDDRNENHRVEMVDLLAALDLYERGATLYFHLGPHLKSDGWHTNICEELGVPVCGQVSIIATKNGRGIRPHFDANDNVTIQLRGGKTWRISENETLKYPTKNWVPSGFIHNDLRSSTTDCIEHITPNNLQSFNLLPGSVLYLPRGFWHGTDVCEEVSISLNLLFPAFTWIDLLTQQLRHRLLSSECWRKSACGIFKETKEIEQVVAEFKLLINELKACINNIKAEDIVPRINRDWDDRVIRGDSLISRCSLARWRIHNVHSENSVVVVFTSAVGFESQKIFRCDMIDILRKIDAITTSLSFNDLCRSQSSIASRRMRRFLRNLWLVGFINVC